jgi:hypothetical protein
MIRQIDKRGEIILFKVTTPKGLTSYRTFPEDQLGNAEAGRDFKTLAAARATMPAIPDTSPKTAPKSANPQNTAGYKADSYSKSAAKKVAK